MLIELVNIGRDAELKYLPSGVPVLSFAAAYDIGFGQNKKTQWIDCAIFGKKAESLADHLTKGKQIQISARDVRIESWDKNDGTGKGFKLACTVDDIKFCRGESSANTHPEQQARQQQVPPRPNAQGGSAPSQPNASAPMTAPSHSSAQQAPQQQAPQSGGGFDGFDDDIQF